MCFGKGAGYMKCYVHKDRDAVGICSVCYKGVCKDCIGTDDPRIICKSCLKKIKSGKLDVYSVGYPLPAKEPVPVKHEKRVEHRESMMRKIFSGKRLPVDDRIDITLLTPVLLLGVTAGILTGIPLLSLLFFLIIPIASAVVIVYIRAEDDFKTVVGIKKGAAAGALTGLVAAIVSFIVVLSLEVMLAGPVYNFIIGTFDFLDENMLNLVLSLSGADRTLSFSVLWIRALISFTLYPMLGALFGALFAKWFR